jgi:hypothetical protein
METEEFKDCHIILDSNRGTYIPRDFVTTINLDLVKDADKFTDDIETCKNPEHEWYWEAWQNILDNMKVDLFGNGVFYSLHHDGDLFAVIYPD